MTPEKLNLNIQTPSGEEGNDEISKLKAEMMSYKPLIDDAIKRQNLKEAEALFKKAKEAKAKLDELREQLKTKENGIYSIEINGTKMELGPEIGIMAFDEIPEKLEVFNKTLKPGEKTWRLPTKEEFEEIGKPIREIWKDESLTRDQKEKKAKEKVESLGFTFNGCYWSSSQDVNFVDEFCDWFSGKGEVHHSKKKCEWNVRIIR
jgi:hypothetical protein